MSSPAPATDPMPSPTPSAPPLPTKPPPPGFKWVKARKPDGTFVTAKKRLTPEELEAQKKADAANPPTPVAPKTDAPSTDVTPAGPTTPDAAVQYKIITARKPDGTLVKVKRPLKPGEVVNNTATTKPAPATPASPDSATATKNETAPCDAPATALEPELSSADKELLREQALANKKHRRGRFGTALLVGLLGVAGSTLPDLMDGDEIMSDTDVDFSDDDDDDDDDDHNDSSDGRKTDPQEASSSSYVAPIAAGVATAAVGAVAAAALAPAPQQQKPADRHLNPDAQQTNGDEKGKGDYKVTVKDLKDLDEKAEETNENKLNRRWANFSFYLMASLSVILPLLFLILAIFIVTMNKKSTSSSWGKMIDAIKIAITVWPIVFAAVTAQGFKTWAAYKVERGVKLMELEQLVGSNSFGAVMKQPFLLRRLDFLTVGIFVIWALSPIGSQALIRSYELKRDEVTATAPVAYVPIMGHNMLLTPNARNAIEDETTRSELWQRASIYFIGSFMGMGTAAGTSTIPQDIYNHPLPVLEYMGPHMDIPNPLGRFGVPVAMPMPKVNSYTSSDPEADKKVQQAARAQDPYEHLTFNMKSSVFKLFCDPWRQEKRSTLDEVPIFTWSESASLGLVFNPANGTAKDSTTPMTRLTYAGLLDDPKTLDRTDGFDLEVNGDWNYGVIDCRWEQVFYNTTAFCSADVKTETNAYDCRMYDSTIIPLDKVKPEWYTPLGDFATQLVLGATPYPVIFPTTPIEQAATGRSSQADGSPAPSNFLLSDDVNFPITPEDFAARFGDMFNTFITLTHCIECIDLNPTLASVRPDLLPTDSDYYGIPSSDPPRVVELYQAPEIDDTGAKGPAQQVYTPEGMIFVIDWRWVTVLVVSAAALLIIGVVSIILESFLIAPDVLGYASSLVRNSRYLHLPKTAAKPMSGPEKARTIGSVSVMIQDVKPDKAVGKIALGLHHDRAEKLKPGRLYR
ncbi:hypothetical protein QBC39DRAFT_413233 [Podospora conica]|nr:hypothetical protein QBC39DRAFT_413233 [Schizothecium conicum]